MAGSVTVGSKDPGRLFLRLCRKITAHEPVMGGGMREFEKWVFDDGPNKSVVLHGTAVEWGVQRNYQVVGGYALTPNVDADFWKEWCSQNKGSPLLVTGILIATPKHADTLVLARQNAGIRSGLEPVDPNKVHNMGDGFTVEIDDSVPKVDTTAAQMEGIL
jgi:hypothetical protein